MKLTRLYRTSNAKIDVIKFGDLSFADIKNSHTQLNLNYFAVVQQDLPDNETKEQTVDLSLMMMETVIGKKDTWQDVVNALTPAMVDSYEVGFLDHEEPKQFIEQISVMNHQGLQVQYTSIKSPNDRDNRSFLWRYKDIVISQATKENIRAVDFGKCLCSVNGLVSRPVLFNDEMFVPGGLTYMLDTRANKHPDLVLLNFEHVGGMTIVPFSDCTHQRLKPSGYRADDWCDFEITLPEGMTFKNKSLMMVIGNTLIFPDKISPVSDRTIHLNPYLFPIHVNIARYLQLSERYIRNTDIYRSNENTIKNYLTNTMFSEEHYGAFFILVDQPSLYIYDMPVYHAVGPKVLHTQGSRGILRHKKSWGLVDYVIDEYNNINVLNLNESRMLYHLYNEFLGEQFGTDTFSCNHYRPKLTNLRYSDFEFVKIFA